MIKSVYNLEFYPYSMEMNIFGYRFTRREDYEERIVRLQHLGSCRSEFNIKTTTGTHEITANVKFTEDEGNSVFEWADNNYGVLSDILLLLSLFTGRDVFVHDSGGLDAQEFAITADPRKYLWGGVLRASVPYIGIPHDEFGFDRDVGLEKTVNDVYNLMRTEDWQTEYRRGYFLLLARQSFKRQTLESTFLQCWTIWEHLFTLQNENRLPRKQIERLSGAEKIAFVLVKYALCNEIDSKSRNRINALAKIRNRLVHFGRFPIHEAVHQDAILFIRLTEFVIAKILGLMPLDLFNTMEKLEQFLSESK